MNKQIKGLIYFYMTDIRFSLIVFWTVLLSSLIVSMLIDYFLLKNVADSFMAFMLSSALYVYCGILGFLTVKQAIPFSIKMGATRKNIFLSLGLFFLGLSISMSILVNTIQSLVEYFHLKIGNDTFMFMHIANLLNDTWHIRVLIDSSIMFFLLSFFFLVGLTFYRYGLIGGGVFVGAIIIVMLTGFSEGWLIKFFVNLYNTLNTVFFWKLIIVALIIYFITWLFMRRITIVHVR